MQYKSQAVLWRKWQRQCSYQRLFSEKVYADWSVLPPSLQETSLLKITPPPTPLQIGLYFLYCSEKDNTFCWRTSRLIIFHWEVPRSNALETVVHLLPSVRQSRQQDPDVVCWVFTELPNLLVPSSCFGYGNLWDGSDHFQVTFLSCLLNKRVSVCDRFKVFHSVIPFKITHFNQRIADSVKFRICTFAEPLFMLMWWLRPGVGD